MSSGAREPGHTSGRGEPVGRTGDVRADVRASVDPPTLDDVLNDVWLALAEGARSARDAFHVPALATLRADGPSVRGVVLRRVDRETGTLGFNTDRRSGKAEDLRTSSKVSWLFYDPERKLQLRIEGVASIHTDDEIAERAWDAVTPLGRRCYGQQPAPGSEDGLDGRALPEVHLPAFDRLRDEDEETVQACRENFCAVQCRVTAIEHLYLRYQGHRRARFTREGEGWTGRWIAP